MTIDSFNKWAIHHGHLQVFDEKGPYAEGKDSQLRVYISPTGVLYEVIYDKTDGNVYEISGRIIDEPGLEM